jgi:predicted phosphoribosyltransferase
MFMDRIDAGMQLAQRLGKYKGEDGVVLAVPRGGVPVGYMVAKTLGFPLDVLLCKKIGHPRNPEYAIGAVSLKDRIVNLPAGVANEYIESEMARLREKMTANERLFRKGRPPAPLSGRTLIVVDDGIATGSTLQCVLPMLRREQPKRIVVAVPVAPASAIRSLKAHADEVVALLVPDDFFAVGSYYDDFSQVEDEEVARYMDLSREQEATAAIARPSKPRESEAASP